MSIWGGYMPESSQNSTGKNSQSDILHSDYLPEYSPKPRYIITTIYPSSAVSIPNERKTEPVNLVSSASIRQGNPDDRSGNGGNVFPTPSVQSDGTREKPNSRRALTVPAQEAAIRTAPELKIEVQGRLRTSADGTGISFLHHGGQETETLRDIPESGKQDSRSIELPRGRFRGVRRNVRLDILLHDLSDNRFTGYCRITHDPSVMIIVLEKGAIILAGYGGLAGDGALDTIYSCRDMLVDAELNELDEHQLSLALEFNPQWRVKERPVILAAGGEAHSRPGPQSESSCDQAAFPSQKLGVSDAGMLISDMKDRAENINEWQKDSALPIKSADFEDAGVAPAIEGDKSEAPDWRRALTLPFIPTGDSSPSLQTGEGKENISRKKQIISFEPLERDSALFESRPDVDDRRFRYVPDASEKWRLMSVNRRENLSV
jgi:hypothetical protein